MKVRNKTVLFTDDIMEYIENPKRLIDKLLQLISKYTKLIYIRTLYKI